MSERQQLALIKKLEKEAAVQAAAELTSSSNSSTTPSSLTPNSHVRSTSRLGHGRTTILYLRTINIRRKEKGAYL